MPMTQWAAHLMPDRRWARDVAFAVGRSAVVAPLAAPVLATADVRHAGVASGVNNAVARAASLLFIAAIPPQVGLTGNAQSHPLVFQHGFRIPILASAGVQRNAFSGRA